MCPVSVAIKKRANTRPRAAAAAAAIDSRALMASVGLLLIGMSNARHACARARRWLSNWRGQIQRRERAARGRWEAWATYISTGTWHEPFIVQQLKCQRNSPSQQSTYPCRHMYVCRYVRDRVRAPDYDSRQSKRERIHAHANELMIHDVLDYRLTCARAPLLVIYRSEFQNPFTVVGRFVNVRLDPVVYRLSLSRRVAPFYLIFFSAKFARLIYEYRTEQLRFTIRGPYRSLWIANRNHFGSNEPNVTVAH